MSPGGPVSVIVDLVVLAADKNIELAMRGLLPRAGDLRVRAIRFDTYPHPQRDPGIGPPPW